MSMLERELESALVKALKGQEFIGADSMWVKPVAGMANAYIAVEIPTASAKFADDSQTAHVTPMFRLLVDIGQVEHLLPAEATADMLRFHGRVFGQLWVQRPFDLSDIIPTTIGARTEVEIHKAVERQVIGRLKIFEDQIDLMAWSIKGLLGLSLELIDGYRLSPLHWKTVLMVLAANGRDGRAAFEHTARLIDAHYGNNIGDAFLKLLDSVPMDRLKLWYLVGADEDPEDFQIQPLPRPGAIVPSRAGWRRQNMPVRAPSGKRVEAIDLNWPADDIDGWVEHTEEIVADFLACDVFFEVDFHDLNFAHAMALECQLLDTFTDYADFSQPQNFYLQTAYLRVFGEFYLHRVPGAGWVRHPDDRWLHPGIQLPDGDVVDLFALCEQIFDKRNGMVTGDALPLGRY